MVKNQALRQILYSSKNSYLISEIKHPRAKKGVAEKGNLIAETGNLIAETDKNLKNRKINAWNQLLSNFFGYPIKQNYLQLLPEQIQAILLDKKDFSHRNLWTKKIFSFLYR